MRRFVKIVAAVLAGCAALASAGATANAQEIELTGPLAGAPAVRKLRLHRDGRFEVSLGTSFTLLDQYERTIMPGGTLTYHVTDWIGFGVFGGYGLQYETGLGNELQGVVNGYNCAGRPEIKACQLTAVNLVQGNTGGTAAKTLGNSQFGHIGWMVAPQVVGVPFRGKISFFSQFFIDTDIDFFAGAAFIGMQERASCGEDTNGAPLANPSPARPRSCSRRASPSRRPSASASTSIPPPPRRTSSGWASSSARSRSRGTPRASTTTATPRRATRTGSSPTAS